MSFYPDVDHAAEFIWRSLEVLEAEHPQAYRLMCSRLSGRQVLVSVEGESVCLEFTSERVYRQSADEAVENTLFLITNWETIFDLLEARLTMTEAVVDRRFDLRGGARDLAIFYDAFLLYLRGAVRCPSFPGLLDRLKVVQSR